MRKRAPDGEDRAPRHQGTPPRRQGPPPRRQGPPPRRQGARPCHENPCPCGQGALPRREGPLPRLQGPPFQRQTRRHTTVAESSRSKSLPIQQNPGGYAVAYEVLLVVPRDKDAAGHHPRELRRPGRLRQLTKTIVGDASTSSYQAEIDECANQGDCIHLCTDVLEDRGRQRHPLEDPGQDAVRRQVRLRDRRERAGLLRRRHRRRQHRLERRLDVRRGLRRLLRRLGRR